MASPTIETAGAREVAAWAASGAMALTADADGRPFGPPAGLVPKLHALATAFEDGVADLGGQVQVDPLRLLTERSAIGGLPVGGVASCGGASRLVAIGSRWLAVTLARPDDVDLVPAWLGLDRPPADPWEALATTRLTADVLAERARLLGLPYGLLPPPDHASGRDPVRVTDLGGASDRIEPLAGLVVVDLSALWAGPLCGRLLAEAGATVVKVESVARPDGARRGPPAFFRLMNAPKRSVALDLRTDGGRGALRRLLGAADVVLEASRPRALAQLGVDAATVVGTGRPRVWVSITGHGRAEPGRDRVGFGDDAAVEGGLVSWRRARPHFCADAVADPVSGLAAATATVEALARGGRWLLDVPMSAVAAHLAGPTRPLEGWAGPVPPPIVPASGPAAPRLGEHTASVLAWLDRPRPRVPPWTSTPT